MLATSERLERWIAGQRVGIASYAYCVTPARFREQVELLALLRDYLQEEPIRRSWDKERFMCQLSPSTLALTRRAIEVRRELETSLGPLGKAQEWLVGLGDPAPFVRAQIWAHHLISGTSSPRQLVRLGRSLFEGIDRPAAGAADWRDMARDPGFILAIAEASEVLRAPGSTTDERLQAVTDIRFEGLGVPPTSWFQIENLLIEYQFGWPLLALAASERGMELGISLPVAVDAEFGSKNKGEVSSNVPEGMFDFNAWQARLIRCAEVGRQLWRSKRGNYGDFKEEVANSKIHFDFAFAQEIGRDLHRVGYRVAVDGGSADTYLAQMVLSRLLGRRGLIGSAVTGALGLRMVDANDHRPLLNYHFDAPSGVRAKLDYAFATRSFERIVLPHGAEEDVDRALVSSTDSDAGTPQTAEVIYAANQQIVADAVQGGQWRQYQYVRCPELVWGIHGEHRYGRPLLLKPDQSEVENVLASLARNQDEAILELPNVRPVAIASALWHLHIQREGMIRPVPPMMSWAFVRLLENEQDGLFWRLIWSLTGASVPAFQKFLRGVGRSEVVETVADLFNRFDPTAEQPGLRAPDILVLLRARPLMEQETKCENPLSRPYMAWPVLKELGKRGLLRGPFHEAYRPLVGKTRIIVVPEEAEDVAPSPLPKDLSPTQAFALRVLSVLEWGFTLQTATLLLSEYPESGRLDVREHICLPLQQRDLLRFAEGRYHIPGPLLRTLRIELERESPGTRAKLHQRAGAALASFASRTDVPGVSLDSAFRPENVSEAEGHLRLAIQLARKANARATAEGAKATLNRVTRFLRVPHWGVVNGFLQSGELIHDAHAMAEELIEIERAAGRPIHPQHLALAGHAAAAVSRQGQAKPDQEQASALKALAENYFQEALQSCAAFASEEQFDRVLVLTDFAFCIARYGIGNAEEIEHLSAEALTLLEQGVSGRAARGDWFEIMGDRELNHERAYRIYRAGTRAAPGWAQLWFKALGSALLSRSTALPPEFEADLERHLGDPQPAGGPESAQRHAERQLVQMLNVIRGSYQRAQGGGSRLVCERWESTLDRLREVWRSSPQVLNAIDKLRQPAQR